MNKLATLTFASLASVAFAGQPVVYDKGGKQPVIPDEACFGETELQLDIYGAFAGTYGDAHEDGWGGGVGINYYFTRNWGVGVDGTVTDGEGEELWHIHGHVLLRFPIETDGGLCLAPYLKAGGGYQVNGSGDWAYGGGAGIEFRVNPSFGIFGEGGYYWSADDDNNYAQAKAGIRFIF